MCYVTVICKIKMLLTRFENLAKHFSILSAFKIECSYMQTNIFLQTHFVSLIHPQNAKKILQRVCKSLTLRETTTLAKTKGVSTRIYRSEVEVC